MKVRDIMTKNLITVDKDRNLRDVMQLMEQHGLTKIPVTENDRLIGILTHARIADKLGRAHNRGIQTTTLHASSVMNKDFAVVHPDEPLANLLQEIDTKGPTIIPVVQGGNLVGIVTKADLLPLVESDRRLEGLMRRELKSVSSGERLIHARRMILDHAIARLPVLADGQVEGIIAEHEIANAFAGFKQADISVQKTSVRDLQVGDYMRRDVITAPPDMSAKDAAHLMIHHHVGALPIVNGGGVIQGIVTRSDLIRTFAS